MPRHPSTQLLTSLGMRKYRLHCRIRYLLTSLRTLSHFARTTFPQRPPRSSQNLHSFVSRRSPRSCKWKQWGSGEVFAEKQRCEAGLRGSLVTHAYSTSSRDAFKTEPPIGLYRDSMAAMQLHLLGLRLGESFSRLSKHINSYFRQKDMLVSPTVGKGDFACVAAEPVRVQHRSLSRALKERRSVENKQSGGAMKPEDVPEASEKKPQQQTGWQLYPGLQLFHISSLATKFGESYSYVANHINSVFPQTPAPLPSEESLQALANKGTRRKRQRAVSNISKVSRPTEPTHLKTDTQSDPEMSSGISSEGYLHFSQHINHYFGAKVADTEEPLHHRKVSHSAHTTSTSMSHQQRSSESPYKFSAERTNDSTIHQSPQSPGLFHMSNLTTRFGENYAYMANHINQYFNGHSDIEETEQESLSEGAEPRVIREEPVSFFQNLLSPTAAIPSLVGRYLGWGSGSHGNHAAAAVKRFESADRTALRRQVVGKKQAEEKTRVLLAKLEKADSVSSVTACVEELNEHLIVNPASKLVVWQAKAVVLLLRQRRRYAADPTLQRAVRETLVLTGYVDPVKGRGIRVLAIDGGGTRGVVPLQVLRQLEALTGKRVHQLFDYVCGVSTGAVLAFMLGLAQISLDECEEMYRRFGSEVFRQNPLVGTVKMGWTHSYYNAETWEMILKEKMGDQVLIKTARDELSPKVSAVSAVVNWGTSPKAFVFRNYNHAPGRLSRYAGGSSYQLWQAVRASSAAPGYFQEFPLHGDIHQDGGLILNNPCALAVHECRLLWPNQHFQCVLSLGTGRYDNARRGPATSTSLRAKISTLIYSATDTEGVHTLLDDLLAPNVYFRFNPMLSAEVSLDESRSGPLDQLQRDTQVYLDRNQLKLARLGLALSAERTAVGRTRDWINERAWELKHSWV